MKEFLLSLLPQAKTAGVAILTMLWAQRWSLGISIATLVGMYLAGKNKRSGWLVNLVTQLVWGGYMIATEQYGFLLPTPFFIWIYAQNFMRWGKAARA